MTRGTISAIVGLISFIFAQAVKNGPDAREQINTIILCTTFGILAGIGGLLLLVWGFFSFD